MTRPLVAVCGLPMPLSRSIIMLYLMLLGTLATAGTDTLALLGAEPSSFLVPSMPPALRRLEWPRRTQGDSGRCNAVALRLMPPASYTDYLNCMREKAKSNSSHDWSVPGAEFAAQARCWCEHNMTATMEAYGCCNHRDVAPMCTLDCASSCNTPLASECIAECPAMCLEAAEYIVDRDLCDSCSWKKCWPVLECITAHAETQTQAGSLDKVCDETAFETSPELQQYWQCFRHLPKHTTHWNILSAVVHCACQEGMPNATEKAHCCDSTIYGGGVCNLECLSEEECSGQKAQTCLGECHSLCASTEQLPDYERLKKCMSRNAPCRRYLSCCPKDHIFHVCDDGRWPEASSGCCFGQNGSKMDEPSCPTLCDEERIWRLDRTRASPWWTRWTKTQKPIYQCSCTECPMSMTESDTKLRSTVSDHIWTNGQDTLIDIARREGLALGPNRHMQELMAERNREILEALKREGGDLTLLQEIIVRISARYATRIAAAARSPDGRFDGRRRNRTGMSYGVFTVLLVIVFAAVCGLGCVGVFLFRRLHSRRAAHELQGDGVVVGNPVVGNGVDTSAQGVHLGAPVTVAAAVASPKVAFTE